MNHPDIMSSPAVHFLLFVLCLLFLLLFLAFLYAKSKTRAEQEYIDFLEETHAVQRKFYEQLLFASHQMHLLRHDMKNHLQTVRHLLADDPEHAAAYLQQLENALQVQCEADASQSAFSHFLSYRRQQAAARELTLQIVPAVLEQSFFQNASDTLLALHALDFAVAQAIPDSKVTLSPLSGGSGFKLSFYGKLSRKELSQWKKRNTSLYGCSGQISVSRQKDAVNISVVFPVQ